MKKPLFAVLFLLAGMSYGFTPTPTPTRIVAPTPVGGGDSGLLREETYQGFIPGPNKTAMPVTGFIVVLITSTPTSTRTPTPLPAGTFTPTRTNTPTATSTPTSTATAVSYWPINGPGWLGPSPSDNLVAIPGQAFNASSTPVQIATPVSSGYTDLYFTVTNIGSANGGGVVYLGGRSVTISALAPLGSRETKVYVQDLSANQPVSLSGDSTAGVTLIYTNIYARRRAP